MARVKWRLPTSKATRMRLLARARRHRDDRLLGRLDDEVPVGADVEHGAGSEQAPGGQRQNQLAPAASAPAAAPTAAPPREHEAIPPASSASATRSPP